MLKTSPFREEAGGVWMLLDWPEGRMDWGRGTENSLYSSTFTNVQNSPK